MKRLEQGRVELTTDFDLPSLSFTFLTLSPTRHGQHVRRPVCLIFSLALYSPPPPRTLTHCVTFVPSVDTAPRTIPSVLPHRASSLNGDTDSDKSDGELFEELEEDEEGFDWGGFREKRMEQLKEE